MSVEIQTATSIHLHFHPLKSMENSHKQNNAVQRIKGEFRSIISSTQTLQPRSLREYSWACVDLSSEIPVSSNTQFSCHTFSIDLACRLCKRYERIYHRRLWSHGPIRRKQIRVDLFVVLIVYLQTKAICMNTQRWN